MPRELDLGKLAALCRGLFTWGTLEGVMSCFRNMFGLGRLYMGWSRTLTLASPLHPLHTSQVPLRRQKGGKKKLAGYLSKCKQVTSLCKHAPAFGVFEPARHLSRRKGRSCLGRCWSGFRVVFSNKPCRFLLRLMRNHRRINPSSSRPQLQDIERSARSWLQCR